MSRRRRRPSDRDVVDAAFDASGGSPAGDGRSAGAKGDSAGTSAAGAAADSVVVAGASCETRAIDGGVTPALWGSPSFFRRAAEELVVSTRTGRELAGTCFLKDSPGRITLVGLRREMSGLPGRVAVDPGWGSVLWHTHPGLKGSLAAFSLEDLDVARQSGKPLLVIGFVGFSLDVLSTLALPFGWRAALAAGGIKALLAVEKSGRLPTRLLELGVGARVCWPSGLIRPVLRRRATPLRRALDDMSFVMDAGVGAIERTGQRALREIATIFTEPRR